jgi:hypothetical protein
MAQQTDSELTAEATVIQDETTAGANTATRIGEMFNNIIDSKVNVDKRPYSVYTAMVSCSSGTLTTVELQNDFTGITFTFTVPSTGVIRCTASSATFSSNLTPSIGGTFSFGGVPYFLSGNRASDTIYTYNIYLHDGTQLTTPNFTQVLFEIRVYNS